MRSSNPVFSRRGFSRDGAAGFQVQQPQAGNPYATTPYAAPQGAGPQAVQAGNPYAQQQTQQPGAPVGAPPAANVPGRMTMNDVVARTGMTLGLLVVAAAFAWVTDLAMPFAIGSAVVAFVLGMVQAFKRKPSPVLILGYAAFEGLFLGALSNVVNTLVNGAAMQAVLGTITVFAVMLALYRTRVIRVTRNFTRFLMIAAISYLVLMGVNALFALFAGGDGLGFRSGGLGLLFGAIGVVLASLFLALDFKQVEDGIAYGAPREESWLAAFGLTTTLVWIYVELLRLVSILQGD